MPLPLSKFPFFFYDVFPFYQFFLSSSFQTRKLMKTILPCSLPSLHAIQLFIAHIQIQTGSFAHKVQIDQSTCLWSLGNQHFAPAQLLFDHFILVTASEPSACCIGSLLDPPNRWECENISIHILASFLYGFCWCADL